MESSSSWRVRSITGLAGCRKGQAAIRLWRREHGDTRQVLPRLRGGNQLCRASASFRGMMRRIQGYVCPVNKNPVDVDGDDTSPGFEGASGERAEYGIRTKWQDNA